MQNNRWTAAVAVIAMAAGLVAGCGTTGNNAKPTTPNQTTAVSAPAEPSYSGPVVATYNGGKLTKAELDAQYNLLVVLPNAAPRLSKADFLKQYVVLYKYVYGQALHEAKQPANAAQAKQMADQAVMQLSASQHETKQAFINKMKSLGLSESDLTLFFEKQQYLNQYFQNLMKNVAVSDSESKAYYDAHRFDYMQVTVEHILVSSEAKAKSIEAQLKSGANFGKLAVQYSQDPAVKQNHGVYSNATVGSFVPPFAHACETLPIGQISDPVHTQFGYHVMKVDKRAQLSFAQAKSQIDQTLLPSVQKQKEQTAYASAQKDAQVKILVKPASL